MTALPPPSPPSIMKNIEGKAPLLASLIRDTNEQLLSKEGGKSYHLFHFIPFLVALEYLVNALPFDYWNDFDGVWDAFDPDSSLSVADDRRALLRFVNATALHIQPYGAQAKKGWDLLHAGQMQPPPYAELAPGQRRTHGVALALFARACHFVYAKQKEQGDLKNVHLTQRTHR